MKIKFIYIAFLLFFITIITYAETIKVNTKNDKDIQSAINQLPPQGGKVIILANTPINIEHSIVISRSNITLEGENAGSIILRLADKANVPVIIMGQDMPSPKVVCKNIHVKNLTIDGNANHQTSETSPSNPALRNNGISLRHIENSSVENVTAFACISGGLVTELGCSQITVRNFESYNNIWDGLAGYETQNSSFTLLKSHNNMGSGLSFDLNFSNNIINNSVLDNNKDMGIFLRMSKNNIFSNLQILNSAENGIFLAQVDTDVTTPAIDNIFDSCVIANSGQVGIRVNDASCTGNILSSSQLINNHDGGISEAVPKLLKTNINCERK